MHRKNTACYTTKKKNNAHKLLHPFSLKLLQTPDNGYSFHKCKQNSHRKQFFF